MEEWLRVRIVYIDYYFEDLQPTSDVSRQPVIRIFGSTWNGQKCCVHIHRVLPYFYVQLPPKLCRDFEEAQTVSSQLVEFLEQSFASSSEQKVIARTELVEKVPFYGYHRHTCFFLKIYTFLPANIQRLADLCHRFPDSSNKDMTLQPYESHISYLSQFMIDYNLYGMNFIRISNPRFRLPLPVTDSFPWKDMNIPWRRSEAIDHTTSLSSLSKTNKGGNIGDSCGQRLFLSEHCEELSRSHCISPQERKSYCDLELDIDASDILNPEDCKDIPLLKDASDKDRLVPSLRGLWEEDERRRRLLGMESYDSEKAESNVKVNLNYSEAHLKEAFRRRVEREWQLLSKESIVDEHNENNNVVNRKRQRNDRDDVEFPSAESLNVGENKEEENSRQCKRDTATELERNEISFFEEDNFAENLWNDILQSSQLLEQDIYQEISSKRASMNDLKEVTGTGEEFILSSQQQPQQNNNNNNNSVDTCSRTLDNNGRSEQDFDPSSGCIQKATPYKDSSVELSSETSAISSTYQEPTTSSPSSTNIQPEELRSNQTSLLSNQNINDDTVWITPRESPPTVEDALASLKSKSSSCKYVPQVTIDSYGRLNTRIVAANSKENNTVETDDLSSSEEDEQHMNAVSESPPVARPCSPKYNEMDNIIETGQSPFYSHDNHRRRSRWSDSSFFSPGFAVEAESNISCTTRESFNSSQHSQEEEQLIPHTSQGLTCMSLEIITKSRKEYLPDPRIDEVRVVCMVIHDDRAQLHLGPAYRNIFHVIVWMEEMTSRHISPVAPGVSMQIVSNEEELFYKVAHWIRYYDVDMIFGYDIHRSSLGYLLERGSHLGWDFARWISRWKETKRDFHDRQEEDKRIELPSTNTSNPADAYMKRLGCHIKIVGRYVFCIWNILKVQVKLSCDDYEAACAMILKKRVPRYEPWVLSSFLCNPQKMHIAYEHCLQKAADNLLFLEELDWISQTSELARIFGIDFRSVITRGSQFRVESMLARLAHANGYLLLSASREQLLSQPAMECLPLVMEPRTNFYQDPVIVMDFQSLYPSIIIAHNLCFCTMFGKVNPTTPCRLGVVESYEPHPLLSVGSSKDGQCSELKRHVNEDDYYVAPNGECFVTKEVRKGILPRLLEEILSTRLMLKSSMKWITEHAEDCRLLGESQKERLWKILNAQQFALKLIANVTYGYTSAAFSGRMPCSGLADAIVQHGRQAMQRSMEEIERGWQSQQEGATVVYGDTDSLFVRVSSVDWRRAWKIGKEMAQHISKQFPCPMRLVLEKVFEPCILLVKKRYVGYAYESLEQEHPVFDAKGIETIRRDSCAAVQKMVERSLRLLFDTRKVSPVKEYLWKKWSRMHRGRNVHWMDFIFSMQVRWGTYRAQMEQSHTAMLPPAAVVASKRVVRDPRAVPLYGERIPFVIAYWMEKPRTLQDCVCSPEEFLALQESGHAVLHVTYYITKQMIPALQRFFSCLGIDVHQWYQQMKRPSTLLSWLMMPRKKRASPCNHSHEISTTSCYPIGGLYYYYHYYICSLCGQNIYDPKEWPLCALCRNHSSWSTLLFIQRWNRQQRKLKQLESVCDYCSRHTTRKEWDCRNFHCPIFFQRHSCQQLKDAYKDRIDSLQW